MTVLKTYPWNVRVFLGASEGWLSESGSLPTADDVEAHFDAVSATERFTIPVGGDLRALWREPLARPRKAR